MAYDPYTLGMKKVTFEELWQDIQDEAEAEGPKAVAELERMQHRFRLGGQLSVLRQRRGLSQSNLAAQTGIDQAEISRIERGVANPTEDTLARLGNALGAKLVFVTERAPVPV